MEPSDDAAWISAAIDQLESPATTTIRRVRSTASKQLRNRPGAYILRVAEYLVDGHHRWWVAYELVYHHHEALHLVDKARAEGVDLVGPGGVLADLTKQVLEVLTEIKNRGVEDACMVVCDGLRDLPESKQPGRWRW